MKYLAAAAILAAAVSPAAAENVFQGDLFFTTPAIQQPACAAAGFAQYDYLRAVFKPANADNATTNSVLTIFGPRYASHYTVTNGSFSGTGNYSGANFSSHGAYYNWNSTFSAATLPAAPNQTSKYVIFKITIAKFLNNAGCTATLQGVLGPRPGL